VLGLQCFQSKYLCLVRSSNFSLGASKYMLHESLVSLKYVMYKPVVSLLDYNFLFLLVLGFLFHLQLQNL